MSACKNCAGKQATGPGSQSQSCTFQAAWLELGPFRGTPTRGDFGKEQFFLGSPGKLHQICTNPNLGSLSAVPVDECYWLFLSSDMG